MSALEQLYSAIEDDQALAELPGIVARLCNARSATLSRFSSAGTLVYAAMNYWKPDHWADYYTKGFITADPWAEAAAAQGARGRAIALDEALPPERFHKTTMYNEMFRLVGDDTARCAGVAAPFLGGSLIVGIHNAGAALPFNAQQIAHLDLAFAHVCRVFRARDTINQALIENRLSLDLVELTGRALLLVDVTLKILRLTEMAKLILDKKDGIGLLFGRLAIDNSRSHQELVASVRGVVNRKLATRDALLCPRRSTVSPYRVVVLPAGENAHGCALIIIDDPVMHDPDTLTRFSRAYRLTTAETILAKGLVEDKTLDEIAVERGVGKETIRSQLRSLFNKTGARRQAELIKLIIQMP